MDGLDLALVRIEHEPDRVRPAVELVAARTAPYDDALRARIRDAATAGPATVARLDFELASRWADDVSAFLESANVAASDVDLIGSHGQTIHHTPRDGSTGAFTLQIGQADVLAARTGILTVSDFRPRDVAAGGEGAPLIPYADWLLYAESDATTACHNLGSIANVTVVTPALEDVIAFDTGPANALIDSFAGGIDMDGQISAHGTVDDDALLSLFTRRSKWLSQAPPKSAGFETFGPALAAEIAAAHPQVERDDLVRTAVEFTANTLRNAYEWHVLTRFPGLRRVRFSGGGTRNPTLMNRILAELGRLDLEVSVLEPRWSDAKEAVGFALLADATLRGTPSNVPAATGATHPVVLGKISL